MPLLSNDSRKFTVGQQRYVISDTLSFYEDCEICYNQHTADTLYRHVLTMIAILDRYCPGEYWAIGWTLLGAVRWQTILPWDDDFDFAITTVGYLRLVAKTRSIQAKYGFELVEAVIGLKVYLDDAPLGDLIVCDYLRGNVLAYSGPVIEGASRFYTHKFIFNQISFRHSDVFPIIRKPFGGTSIAAPCGYRRILLNNYNSSIFTTIRTPQFQSIHSFPPKACYKLVERTMKSSIKFPNMTQLLCHIIGLIIHYNMRGVYSGGAFTDSTVSVAGVACELANPECVGIIVELLSSLR